MAIPPPLPPLRNDQFVVSIRLSTFNVLQQGSSDVCEVKMMCFLVFDGLQIRSEYLMFSIDVPSVVDVLDDAALCCCTFFSQKISFCSQNLAV